PRSTASRPSPGGGALARRNAQIGEVPLGTAAHPETNATGFGCGFGIGQRKFLLAVDRHSDPRIFDVELERDPFVVGNVCSGPRLCENAQEPAIRRIVFSIALFPIPATALSLLRLAKSRRIFYAQIECLCFHTGWTRSARPDTPCAAGRISSPDR